MVDSYRLWPVVLTDRGVKNAVVLPGTIDTLSTSNTEVMQGSVQN
jgi:hypothetical protein